jgi:MFS superfamily sulfate permease-like transporter
MNPITPTPKDYLGGLAQNWKADLQSGFFVFLLALPLSIGISLASTGGYTPMAGLVAAVVGGLVVSLLASSHVSINGPAAGLIVVMLTAAETLGGGNAAAGFHQMLAAVVVAGVILTILGLLRLGWLTTYFPASAVHGLLAAIGIIIISKQFPLVVGVTPDVKAPLDLLAAIPRFILQLNPQIAIIGLGSIAIMAIMPMVKHPVISRIPGPLVVLAVMIPLGFVFDFNHAHNYEMFGGTFMIEPTKALLNLPVDLSSAFQMPDFSSVLTGPFVQVTLVIAAVQGIETLASSVAVMKLDPWKRKVNLNRDLLAIGAGTAVSGMIGGLPMITEIVRSSANIHNGARTRWANFFHGMFLVLFLAFAAQYLHFIPTAALAGLLVFTGYRLGSPKHFIEMYRIGYVPLITFVITVVVTLATDMLIGLGAGVFAKWMCMLFEGANPRFYFRPSISIDNSKPGEATVHVFESLVFSNYLGFMKKLEDIPITTHVKVDFSETRSIDYSTLESIFQYRNDRIREGGQIEYIGMEQMTPTTDHPLSPRRKTKEEHHEISRRRRELEIFAKNLKGTFYPVTSAAPIELHSYPLALRVTPQWISNLIITTLNGVEVRIMDVSSSPIAGVKHIQKERVHASALWIPDARVVIPHLMRLELHKEPLLSKLLDSSEMRVVTFDDFPEFGLQYQLHASDPQKATALFNPQLIQFLVENPGYHIESDGIGLIIYQNSYKALPIELLGYYQFASGLLENASSKQPA